jgi:hypothetical protein
MILVLNTYPRKRALTVVTPQFASKAAEVRKQSSFINTNKIELITDPANFGGGDDVLG